MVLVPGNLRARHIHCDGGCGIQRGLSELDRARWVAGLGGEGDSIAQRECGFEQPPAGFGGRREERSELVHRISLDPIGVSVPGAITLRGDITQGHCCRKNDRDTEPRSLVAQDWNGHPPSVLLGVGRESRDQNTLSRDDGRRDIRSRIACGKPKGVIGARAGESHFNLEEFRKRRNDRFHPFVRGIRLCEHSILARHRKPVDLADDHALLDTDVDDRGRLAR